MKNEARKYLVKLGYNKYLSTEQIDSLSTHLAEFAMHKLGKVSVIPSFSDFVKHHKGIKGFSKTVFLKDWSGAANEYVLMKIVKDYFE